MRNVLSYEDILDLQNYWRIAPPADLLVAAYLGYKPPPDPNGLAADSKPIGWLDMPPAERAERDRKVLEDYERAFQRGVAVR